MPRSPWVASGTLSSGLRRPRGSGPSVASRSRCKSSETQRQPRSGQDVAMLGGTGHSPAVTPGDKRGSA
jgi:hypothetical protein